MILNFTTENCARCYIAHGLLTGCDPNRKANCSKNCAKCDGLLVPKGEINGLRRIAIHDKDGEQVATGFMLQVTRASDKGMDWYLAHAVNSSRSPINHLVGLKGEKLKEWIDKHGHQATWPENNHPSLPILKFPTANKNGHKDKTSTKPVPQPQ